ncbi:hypothetical protein [Fundidesulfovibrio terrae]|uniref:hypothetical protein n=1 Tax=Fundidesulfovibrio terrae TaxID=2922866 RepID=UPI001FAF4A85|nr:hypothetical protein [Fundidesulfovibrio terrae]
MSAMKTMNYESIRKEMLPGDVLAFSGKGNASEIIKNVTRSSVSHIGIVLQTTERFDETDRFFNQIIESTSLDGFSGVIISRLSQRLRAYDGEVWWLPLNRNSRQATFNAEKFHNFLMQQEGKLYDTIQAVKSAIDIFDKIHGPGYNYEDFSRFFCSELAAGGLEASGFVPKVNASEVTPIDLCRWKIYEDSYVLLQGDGSKGIRGFNTMNPSDWNI